MLRLRQRLGLAKLLETEVNSRKLELKFKSPNRLYIAKFQPNLSQSRCPLAKLQPQPSLSSLNPYHSGNPWLHLVQDRICLSSVCQASMQQPKLWQHRSQRRLIKRSRPKSSLKSKLKLTRRDKLSRKPTQSQRNNSLITSHSIESGT